jgi:hypothetical protein
MEELALFFQVARALELVREAKGYRSSSPANIRRRLTSVVTASGFCRFQNIEIDSPLRPAAVPLRHLSMVSASSGDDAESLGALVGLFSIGQINFLVASSVSYALVGLLVPPEDSGATLGAFDILFELSGEAAPLIIQFGGLVATALRHSAGRSVHFVLRNRPHADDDDDLSPEALGDPVGE